MDEPDVRDLPVRNECTTEAQVSVIAVSSANYAWFLRVPWEVPLPNGKRTQVNEDDTSQVEVSY